MTPTKHVGWLGGTDCKQPRWEVCMFYLGYDASCGTCRAVALAAQEAAGGSLEIEPLQSRRMLDWHRTIGRAPVFEPTLVQVHGGAVSGMWHGRAMGALLVKEFGFKAGLRMAEALRSGVTLGAAATSRRTFMSRVALGGAVRGGSIHDQPS